MGRTILPRLYLMARLTFNALFVSGLSVTHVSPLLADSVGYNRGCDGAVRCGSSGASSGGFSSGNDIATQPMIEQGGELLIQILEDRDRERQMRQDEEQRQLQQEIMLREQEKQMRLDKARDDTTLNPWESGPKFERSKSATSSPSGDSPKVGTNASLAKPKDPSLNYEGRGCEYFTRPSDEAHLNYHSDGAVMSYGNNVYKCENGRWKFLSTRDKYWKSTKHLDASWFEGGSAE
ncbi:hypothetical protein WCE02_06495 [Pseudomonas juntendi]|uniref:hypothetical protein n=1 Tax=Pseudomonas juntendi TaxID=2666183 RepID=UPI0034D45970